MNHSLAFPSTLDSLGEGVAQTLTDSLESLSQDLESTAYECLSSTSISGDRIDALGAGLLYLAAEVQPGSPCGERVPTLKQLLSTMDILGQAAIWLEERSRQKEISSVELSRGLHELAARCWELVTEILLLSLGMEEKAEAKRLEVTPTFRFEPQVPAG